MHDEDKKAGLVTITKTPDGQVFDWGNTPAGEFFGIKSSEGRPDNAFIAALYRDRWFYIADNDLKTKRRFMLLKQLFNLQAGQTKTVAPTLTIPVRESGFQVAADLDSEQVFFEGFPIKVKM